MNAILGVPAALGSELPRIGAALAHRGAQETYVFGQMAIGGRFQDTPNLCDRDGIVVAYSGIPLMARTGAGYALPIDAEQLHANYRKNGIDLFRRIEGHFALAVWDSRADRLVLARDSFGVQNLAYARCGKGLAFATEYKALLPLPEVRPGLDHGAIDYFLAHGWAPAGTTFVSAIRTVLPGSILTFERGTLEIIPADYGRLRPPSDRVSVDSIRNAVEAAIATHAYDDQLRYGVMLSSGVDSATITACLSQRSRSEPLHSFTVGYGEDDPEILGARETAEHLGTIHHPLIIRPEDLTGLLPDTIRTIDNPGGYDEFPCLLALHREARKYVDVIFSGNAVDTLFAGMPYHRDIPPAPFALFEELRLNLAGRDERMGAQELLAGAAGLSFRMPYAEQPLIALALATPDEQKLGPDGNKLIFRAAAGQILPDRITQRPKRIQHLGYGDAMASWMAGRMDSLLSAPGSASLFGQRRLHMLAHGAGQSLDATTFPPQWNAIALSCWADIYRP